jgi:predicted RNA-binding Zn ribbon-like protein
MPTQSPAAKLDLVGGSLAFDFANTAGGRNLPVPIENLPSHDDLLAWACHAGLLSVATNSELGAAIRRDPRLGVHLLNTAHDLRDAIYEIGAAFAHGRKPAGSDLATLKDHYARAVAAAVLLSSKQATYSFDFSNAPAEFLLFGPIAVSAMEILTSADKSRIKQCPAEDCGWLFIDSSKNHSRRWCDMATCGNRMKGRAHRERHS